MAYYAFLNEENIVVEVIVGKDEFESGLDWEWCYASFRGLACKRTSYNTTANRHPKGAPFRKNYAGIGYTYDHFRDAFIPPKPFPSWILDEETCLWVAPKPHPDDLRSYEWDELTGRWLSVDDNTITNPYPTT